MSRRKEAPASLAAVKLRRAPRRIEGSDKAGDITAQLLPPDAAPPEPLVPPPPSAPPPPPLVAVVLAAPEPQPSPVAILLPEPSLMTPLALEIDAEPLVPLPAPPAPATPPASEGFARPAKGHEYWEFIDYWNRLRRDQPVPALTLLDRELVAESWPDSLMVTYASLDAPVPQIARMSRPTGQIEYTPMVTDWIISCARQVARYGEAMEDEQEFPLAGGTTGYRLLLLPFASAQGESDHVLCHLSRAKDVARL